MPNQLNFNPKPVQKPKIKPGQMLGGDINEMDSFETQVSSKTDGFFSLDAAVSTYTGVEIAPKVEAPTVEIEIKKSGFQSSGEIEFNSKSDFERTQLIKSIEDSHESPSENNLENVFINVTSEDFPDVLEAKIEEPTILQEADAPNIIADALKEKSGEILKTGPKQILESFKIVAGMITEFFQGFLKKDRKEDPKEQEKKATRTANKRGFFDAMRSAAFELKYERRQKRTERQIKLGIVGMSADQMNENLDKNRNKSYRGVLDENDEGEYIDTNTAFGVVERRKASMKPAAIPQPVAKGGPSKKSRFSQSKFAGEQAAGGHAQSAAG